MTAPLLCLLALADAAFSGFRAYAGRDGRIDTLAHKLAAGRIGALAGVVALAVIGLGLGSMLAVGAATYGELTQAGARMLTVYGIYATAIAVGFAAYFSPSLEVRSVGTILLLGPGTLIRPLVVVGGAVFAGWGGGGAVMAAAVFAASVMLGLELVLDRHFARAFTAWPPR